jgi:two-component system, NtrC family, response regulator
MSDKQRKLLIVDDDTGIQRQLRWSFDEYDVSVAGDREEAIAQFRSEAPAVVTVDLGLPPDPDGATEGFATVEEILKLSPDSKVIVVTGNEDHDNALKAVALGAYDFYRKPIDSDELGHIIQRAYQLYDLEQENRRLAERGSNAALTGVICADPEMLKVCRLVEKVAPTNVTAMLLGESGTGKEVLARAVHELSPRADKPFAAINCAAIPENLLESELFGHEKGSFTGAVRQQKGKVELADSGTLFLDEVGDMPAAIQAKLLRFLQERTFERIGGRQSIAVDVRVICATNQKLEEMIAAGTFREDLYYRLSEMVINIPPLRDRIGDAEMLAQVFLQKFAEEQGKSIRGYTREALAAISGYQWPGNVRELENRRKTLIRKSMDLPKYLTSPKRGKMRKKGKYRGHCRAPKAT